MDRQTIERDKAHGLKLVEDFEAYPERETLVAASGFLTACHPQALVELGREGVVERFSVTARGLREGMRWVREQLRAGAVGFRCDDSGQFMECASCIGANGEASVEGWGRAKFESGATPISEADAREDARRCFGCGEWWGSWAAMTREKADGAA